MSKSQPIARALTQAIAITAAVTCGGGATAASLNEGFDDVRLLSGLGWTQQNNSTEPGGLPNWIQAGAGGTLPFPAHQGDKPDYAQELESYISVDYDSVKNRSNRTETISNWLILPKLTFNNGDVLKFYTRTDGGSAFADRLQVRFGAGAAPSPGTGETSVGSFTTLLLDINPNYAFGTGQYPVNWTPGGYPEEWTEYTVAITGLSGATDGKIAFRYFVEDGGSGGDRSLFIGLDTVSITAAPPVPHVPEPAAYLMMALGLGVIGLRRMRAARG